MDLLPVRANQVIITLRECPVECRVYGWGHLIGGITRLELTASSHQSTPTLLTQFAGLPVFTEKHEYVELHEDQFTIEMVNNQLHLYMGEEKVGLVSVLDLRLDVHAPAPKCRIRFLENADEATVLTPQLRDTLAGHWTALRRLPWIEVEAPTSFKGPAMHMPGTLPGPVATPYSDISLRKHEE